MVAGLAAYVKLLIAVLLVGIVVGLLVVGPRSRLRSPYVLGGGALAVLVTLPNLVYQATHDLPQLRMGAALSDHNAGEVRWFMWVFLVIVLGPPLVWVWGRGLVELWRRPDVAAGAVPGAGLRRGAAVHVRRRQPAALPDVPPDRAVRGRLRRRRPAGLAVAGRPEHGGRGWSSRCRSSRCRCSAARRCPDINLLAADSVGWPEYVDQVEAAYASLPPAERAGAVVVASNYGEAGALVRLGDGLPAVYSGHNALGDRPAPPESVTTVVFVGGQVADVRDAFGTCEVVDRLDNGVDVDNEEQGQPVSVCRDRTRSWSMIWADLKHLD